MANAVNLSRPTTHSCFQFVVILAQCFGLFPVSGITGSTHSSLHFKWLSAKVAYTLIFLIGVSINILFYIHKLIVTPGPFLRCVPIMFFGIIFLTIIAFFQLARLWPNVIGKWTEVDDHMKSYGFPKKMGRKIKIITLVVTIAAALEHALFIWHGLDSLSTELKGKSIVDGYFKINFDNIFSFVPYNFWIGFFFELLSLYSTFTWNYMDLFIMVVSTTLSARFKQVARRLSSLADVKVKNESVWMIVREDYDRLNQLCKTVDVAISNITFLSFTNNLFFIIVQLYNTLDAKDNNLIGQIYFTYSFAFLIIRTVAVTLYAGMIDYESKKPARVLNALPYDIYNIEIDRFLQQVKIDPSAFTGKGFFRVRKSLVLSIAGAIVTYELILMQFNEL